MMRGGGPGEGVPARRAASTCRASRRTCTQEIIRIGPRGDCKGKNCKLPMLAEAFRWNGLNLASVDAQLGRYFGTDRGVLVLSAGADLAGLQAGDVIQQDRWQGGRTRRAKRWRHCAPSTPNAMALGIPARPQGREHAGEGARRLPLRVPPPPPAPPAPPRAAEGTAAASAAAVGDAGRRHDRDLRDGTPSRRSRRKRAMPISCSKTRRSAPTCRKRPRRRASSTRSARKPRATRCDVPRQDRSPLPAAPTCRRRSARPVRALRGSAAAAPCASRPAARSTRAGCAGTTRSPAAPARRRVRCASCGELRARVRRGAIRHRPAPTSAATHSLPGRGARRPARRRCTCRSAGPRPAATRSSCPGRLRRTAARIRVRRARGAAGCTAAAPSSAHAGGARARPCAPRGSPAPAIPTCPSTAPCPAGRACPSPSTVSSIGVSGSGRWQKYRSR